MNLVKLIKCGALLSGGSAEENFRPNRHRCGDHQISVNQHEKGHSVQNSKVMLFLFSDNYSALQFTVQQSVLDLFFSSSFTQIGKSVKSVKFTSSKSGE